MQKAISVELDEAIAANHDLEARLAQSEQALKDANAVIAERAGQLTLTMNELTAAGNKLTVSASAVIERDAQIVQLTARVTELETQATTVSQKAGEMFANISTSAITGAAEPVKPTKNELWAQYHALPITKQREFYLANQKEMSA